MTHGDGSPLRIGTAERTAALEALDEHLAAGRLDIDEYANRSATAANATVAAELAALFVDLPAPHPVLPGAGPALPPTTAFPVVPPPAGHGAPWGPRMVVLTVVVAVALYALTRQWHVFLLIPAAAALVYGGGLGRR